MDDGFSGFRFSPEMIFEVGGSSGFYRFGFGRIRFGFWFFVELANQLLVFRKHVVVKITESSYGHVAGDFQPPLGQWEKDVVAYS